MRVNTRHQRLRRVAGLCGLELLVGLALSKNRAARVGTERPRTTRAGGAQQPQGLTRRGMSWPSAWALARIVSGSKPAARAARAASR